MVASTGEDVFLTALAADARDDATRGVYADFLEESGDAARATYLRMQLAPARDPAAYQRLRSAVPREWRVRVARWLATSEHEALALEPALARIRESCVPHAEALADRLRDHVEALGVEDDDPYGIVHVYSGDVAAGAHFHVSMHPVVVLGDLRIEGELTDLIESDQSLTVIAGDLQCKLLWQLGDMLVAGDLQCDGVCYGSSFHANRTEVLGDVRARVLFERSHHFVIHGALSAVAVLGTKIEVSGRRPPSGGEVVLVPDVLDEDDGEVDEERLYRWLQDGKDILR